MKPTRRAGVVLIANDQVAVIKRVNDRGTYYLFPGGGVEEGETVEEAAIREALEELGLYVKLTGLLAIVEFKQRVQYYYLAKTVGGVFGTGNGEELASPPSCAVGTYTPMWLACQTLNKFNVRPSELARLIAEGLDSLPPTLLQIKEEAV